LNDALGVSLPIRRNRIGGYDMIRDYAHLTDQNLKSLILTSPGERFDTEYGVGLKRYLFELMVPSVFQSFKSELMRQQQIYIPYIKITSVQFVTSETNPNLAENYLGIKITYYSTLTRSSRDMEVIQLV
jgi:phage baseplate assembly protein W